jgi:hypothetical protein
VIGSNYCSLLTLDLEPDRESLEYLDHRLAVLHAAGIKAEGLTRIGEPGREIASMVSESHSDIVVMSTHARHGLERLLLGSVAEELLQRVDRPLMLVPRRDSPRRGAKRGNAVQGILADPFGWGSHRRPGKLEALARRVTKTDATGRPDHLKR